MHTTWDLFITFFYGSRVTWHEGAWLEGKQLSSLSVLIKLIDKVEIALPKSAKTEITFTLPHHPSGDYEVV